MQLQANWIRPREAEEYASYLFCKQFSLRAPLRCATLRITARGVYEAKINGERVGRFFMAPGWTWYPVRVQVQEYDVTALLRQENDLTVQLANGWFGGTEEWRNNAHEAYNKGAYDLPCAILAELTLCYEDGTREVLGTDTDWLTAKSGLSYCDLYNGAVFDASYEPDFSSHAVLADDNSQEALIPQMGEEVTEQETLAPIAILHTPRGETVIDFGQNLTGYPVITLSAHKGDRVSLSFGEILDDDGNFYNENYRTAKCLYDYTCREGEQTYKPNLTFYGFRYLRVDAFPTEPTVDSFRATVVHSSLRRTGYIETSDPLLTQLYSNIVWGQRSNYLDVPTDCPQRNERLGWLGDTQAFIRTACYNYDVRKFFRKWLTDVKLQQHPDGSLCGIIPGHFNTITSAAWADAVTICPWQLYLSFGEREFLELMFPSMKKWVDYITNTTTKPGLWFGGEHFGDWLELKAPFGSYKGATRDDLIASAFYAHSTDLVCRTGRLLGEDVSAYEALYTRIVAAFREEFREDYKTQTEHVLALHFHLTADPAATAKSLTDMIHADGDKLQTGFVGTPYLLHALSDNGYADLAYTLLLRRDFPSWLYPVTRGATTMWEHWDGIKPDGTFWPVDMNSFNHYAYGAVGDWMYGVMAGIQPVEEAPGYAHVRIAPIPTDRIDSISASLESPHGLIRSGWHHEGDRVIYQITTPVPATLILDGVSRELAPGSYEIEN